MNRFALLIQSPGPKDNYLSATTYDVAKYENFLASPTGGAWERGKDMFIVKNPRKNTIINAIKQSKTLDYLHIYYSGHGRRLNGQTILLLNPNEEIAVRDLLSTSPKQSILLDTCSSFSNDSMLGFAGQTVYTYPSQIDKVTARQRYNQYLKTCANGKVICYSSSKGEYSYAASDGSTFTNSLLYTTKKWSETSDQYGVLPINTALNRAKNHITYTVPADELQTPRLAYDYSGKNWFPFALKQPEDWFWGNL